MIDTIYIEENIRQHPRVIEICKRFPLAKKISCNRYGEVFNPKAQNFRLQKQKPALILAEKYKNYILPAPPGYGIGAAKNFYFSHMLNCLYDCRYCFLQGMFHSANYLLFVNYEDFQNEIRQICHDSPDQPIHFFSGYDCDSLALEPVTRFAAEFLPIFENIDNAWLELRTKSTQIRSLLDRTPVPRAIEHKAPTIEKRLDAMCKLQEQGWLLGLRFDPVIFQSGWQQQYQQLFEQVFSRIKLDLLHSVNLGAFRLPEQYFKKTHKLYPEEKLFAGPLEKTNGMISYRPQLEQEMLDFCKEDLLRYIPESKLFPCTI
jgi:spore photoproduct lyase